jgi:ATP-dependent DNA ligase
VVRRGSTARLWTHNRNDISDRFPDIVAAAENHLPEGVVLDGELVILGADVRLSIDAQQQRLVTSPATARSKAAQLPAAYAAFDLLAIGGVDLRTQAGQVRHGVRYVQLRQDLGPEDLPTLPDDS